MVGEVVDALLLFRVTSGLGIWLIPCCRQGEFLVHNF